MVGPYFTTALANGKLAADKAARFQPLLHLGDLDIHLIANHRVALKKRTDLSLPVVKPWMCAASGGQFTTICDLLARDYPRNVLSVPYSGEAQALNDLLGGHVDLMPITGLFAAQRVEAGSVALLADLSARPGIGQGAVQSVVFGGAIKSFYGFVATRQMPQGLVNQLNQDINRLIKSQALDASASALGVRLTGGRPSDLGALLRENTAVQSRLLEATR
jgi:tripartite-type tricarboxylate transporter receptor subunit TctC